MTKIVQMNEDHWLANYKGEIIGNLGDKSIIKCADYAFTIVCNVDEYKVLEGDLE